MTPLMKAEDWLPVLWRALDLLSRPTFNNFVQSFESWEHQVGLRPPLKQLQRARLIQRNEPGKSHFLEITPAGKLAAMGGIDPVQRWDRKWDGRWRMLLFDLPARNQSLRLRLWRWLRASRFGYLQLSVWICPDPISEESLPLQQLKLPPDAFMTIDARPSNATSDEGLVKAAWDFKQINANYEKVRQLARLGMEMAESERVKPAEIRRWLREDRLLWEQAVSLDPLLPEALLPNAYPGREAWNLRNQALSALARRTIKEQNL